MQRRQARLGNIPPNVATRSPGELPDRRPSFTAADEWNGPPWGPPNAFRSNQRFRGRLPPPPNAKFKTAQLVGILLITLLITSLATYGIVRPLNLLSVALAEVRRGNTRITIPIDRNDEIGQLARSFNEMTTSLDSLMRDKEQLFMEISHEFRAPIARASAATGMVDDRELRSTIQENLKELDSLIHALLIAARLEAGNTGVSLEQVDLVEVVREVSELFPGSRQRLQVTPVAGPVLCECEKRSVRTLFRNLTENALKYSPSDQEVILSVGMNGDRAFFSVEDKGAGIPLEDTNQIFQPYFRGKTGRSAQPGFGLGLALCQRIVRAHGGELDLVSEPGKGTLFTAFLPLRRPAVAKAA